MGGLAAHTQQEIRFTLLVCSAYSAAQQPSLGTEKTRGKEGVREVAGWRIKTFTPDFRATMLLSKGIKEGRRSFS